MPVTNKHAEKVSGLIFWFIAVSTLCGIYQMFFHRCSCTPLGFLKEILDFCCFLLLLLLLLFWSDSFPKPKQDEEEV